MGTCISKCSSATEDCNPIQDKLVITQSPIPTFSPSKDTISKNPFPPSLSYSSSPTPTVSTTSTTTTTTITTTTSSCSSSSSCISKDRSFSNEFLWSCIKENPQVILVDQVEIKSPTKKKPSKSPTPSSKTNRRSKANAAPTKQSIPEPTTPSKQPKKASERSPSPAQQRSSRKEPGRSQRPMVSLSKQNLGSHSPIRRFNMRAGSDVVSGSAQDQVACKRQVSSRGLSPSPSRRFNGIAGRELSKNPQEENRKCGKVCVGLSPNPSRRFERDAINHRGLSPSPSRKFNGDVNKIGAGLMGNGHFPVAVEEEEKVSLSTMSPSHGPCLKNRGSCMVSSHPQVDENVVGSIISKHDSGSPLSLEDIDNPLISLDCFIFL